MSSRGGRMVVVESQFEPQCLKDWIVSGTPLSHPVFLSLVASCAAREAVTSCNADFNLARLERYLIMANQAGSNPVIVLTKADTAQDAGMFRAQAEALQRDLPSLLK